MINIKMGNLRKFIKKNNKTYLNAFYMILSTLALLFIMGNTYYSTMENSCNNDVTKLLLDKNQQFLEKQNLLIERGYYITRRDIFESTENIEKTQDAQEMISAPYVEYKKFTNDWNAKNFIIKEKIDECDKYSRFSNIFWFVSFFFILLQIIVSSLYLRKY